jgi:hypothetical protein
MAMKLRRKESGIVDVVVIVAALCLAVIVIGLIVPASRELAIKFGFYVFLVLVAAGIAVAGRVGWILARHALRRR